MSYLDQPRIHFAGRFIAKPSTVNNSTDNYSRTLDEIIKSGSFGFNRNGDHQWQFDACTVRSAVGGADGDSVIGAAVQSTNQPSNAKLVDLDPQQQMVSQIWGLGIRLVAANGDSFEGSFDVVPFNDIWFNRSPPGGLGNASAYYQSTLRNVVWSRTLRSPTLRKLRDVSPDTLSIKFVVDSYVPSSPFRGRIVGTIGPQQPFQREPNNFVPGRLLRPVDQRVTFAPARVDRQRSSVLVDLGNSLPFTAAGGPYASLGGPLQLALLPAGQRPQLLGPVGNVPYEENAGVYEVPLSTEQLARVNNTPLGVVRASTGGTHVVLLAENSIGAYLDATQYVFRLNPGGRIKLSLHAYAFGRPKANQIIRLSGRTMSGGAISGNPPPLSFPASVTTNASGGISVTLSAADPGTPRAPIDGQVFKVTFTWDGAPADFNADPNRCLSVRVFSDFTVPTRPTWANIEPIFAQYAKLYEFMRGIIDLSDPAAVQQALARISDVMGLPEKDPRYMPVTRDLSGNKKKAILRWISNGGPL